RDYKVTGVQTCALPISAEGDLLQDGAGVVAQAAVARAGVGEADPWDRNRATAEGGGGVEVLALGDPPEPEFRAGAGIPRPLGNRSEERRVGKECRERWS